MGKLRSLIIICLAGAVFGCATAEHDLQHANSLLLSSREVRDVFQGNTVVATTGEAFYWDASGAVTGKGAFGGTIRGNWNIADDGRLCVSNWNSANAPTGCFRVYFDNSTQQRKLVDMNGDLKYTVMNVLTGNPNNF